MLTERLDDRLQTDHVIVDGGIGNDVIDLSNVTAPYSFVHLDYENINGALTFTLPADDMQSNLNVMFSVEDADVCVEAVEDEGLVLGFKGGDACGQICHRRSPV